MTGHGSRKMMYPLEPGVNDLKLIPCIADDGDSVQSPDSSPHDLGVSLFRSRSTVSGPGCSFGSLQPVWIDSSQSILRTSLDLDTLYHLGREQILL
ncbi:hypothetical protein VTN77DRAFT_2372 [Rasamsonia byssochlamydoides]|uniref:uncharacterized protein n=1 Tax=Rasamsonia byssochlamydoides TaxID=89139 RepID=UPI0037441789